MLSKDAVIFYSDDVVLVVFVMIVKVFQYFQFNACLVLKLLLISDDFDRNVFFGLVIEAFDGLSEGTLSKEFVNFITVG
jgi:hypothetical protein